jgi:hypothetical protein
MIALLAALALQGSDLPATPVTAHLGAMTVSQALGLISKKANATLTADDSLKNDIVLIRVENAPLKELGRQLAQALDADWKGSGSSFALSRSPDAIKKEEDEQLAFDARGFELTQNKLKQDDKALPEWDAQAARNLAKQLLDAQDKKPADPQLEQTLVAQTPSMRLFNRLLASVPPAELAQIAAWGRVVYTVRPNHEQRPVSIEGASALIAYLSDQELWTGAAAAFSNLNLSPGLSSAKPFRTDPKKVYLALSREDGPALQAELRVVDSAGNDLAILAGSISPSAQSNALTEIQRGSQPLPPISASTIVAKALKSGGDLRSLGAGEAALRSQMKSPETSDPLGWLPGEVIDAASTGLTPNLVALIPDEAMSLYRTLDLETATRGGVWQALGKLDMIAIKDGDWLRVRPIRMAAEHENRLDRALMGGLMRDFPDGPAHLEKIAAIALTPGGATRSEILTDMLLLWSKPLSDQVSKIDWTALRVFGALGDKERETLQAGATINILELPKTTQAVIREMIDRGLYPIPRKNLPGAKFIKLPGLEPTDVLPNGVTSDATIGGTFTVTPIAAEPPAVNRLPSDDDKRIPPGDVLDKLKAGSQVVYGMNYLLDIRVHLFPSLYSGGALEEAFYMGTAKTEADLPEPYKTAIARYRKS